ncbi:BEACH domain-containing protein B-like isoform X4 [Apium graveolens]|uniref:BEACH domain-containing protein B-like isoform X4 n=1 Tax=Apium graveolens TaxID=4045 RepID=UPI003D7B47E7
MRGMIQMKQRYYQALFRHGECFLHLSLLNGNLEEENGEKLVLSVLETLTCLLANNDISKDAFRALVGKGYRTLQSLLLDFCQWRPSEGLLNALLDMLVDGKFDLNTKSVIKKVGNCYFFNGQSRMLNYLIDWFSQEEDDGVDLKLAQLIQVTGGHSISGKNIRKMFALLRSEKVGTRQQYCSLLLTSILSMMNEKGPTAFFDLNGYNSGIIIKMPVHWPLYKGFSFSCWFRVENFPRTETMGLFSFLTENGRGCLAALAKDKLFYESVNQKQQCVSLNVNLVRKKWHFLCLTHSIGRAFSGGSQVRCYVEEFLYRQESADIIVFPILIFPIFITVLITPVWGLCCSIFFG